MTEKLRPYLFYDVAISICSTCYRRVDAKIVFEDNKVWMLKRCPEHGHERVLVADDVDYYRRSREVFIKTPEQPMVYNTPVKYGCPYDCGICPDHEQHSCVALIEICDACNLTCPICYAGSGQHRSEYRTLEQIEAMLDCIVRNEKHPDVVQISGGEPTLHPDFFRIIEMCQQRPMRHLMVNTNGIRIAQDEEFAKRLAASAPDLELYLQFDSFQRDPLMQLRGADLRSMREKALERLNRLGISTTLVVTVKRGVNDNELGAIIDFALTQPAVRGVTFQPIQQAGRMLGFNSAEHRLTLTEVRRRIIEQTSLFKPEDLIPVPCHPDSLAMAYAVKMDGKTIPLTGMLPPELLIDGARNTIVYEQEEGLRNQIFKLFATNHSPSAQASTLRELLLSLPRELACCLPKFALRKDMGYKNIFRVLIVQFIDAQAFDVRSVKKSCIHIAHPDGKRLIPFDTFNMFYRGDLEQTRLAALRGLEVGQTMEEKDKLSCTI
ncbi:MAG: radical SAM protein [Terracidiphilus sp.]|nr:radical SAM protein [Terracidiphilus sp.]MDR3797166.1 radical SAM protein [Terracidiphilus sp.]